MIDAIAFKYRTGIPWTDLPEHFGSWNGAHNRLRIPQPSDQAANRKRRGRLGGRPPRCINRLKQWRGLATRYDKTATIYLAGLRLAAIFIWSAR